MQVLKLSLHQGCIFLLFLFFWGGAKYELIACWRKKMIERGRKRGENANW